MTFQENWFENILTVKIGQLTRQNFFQCDLIFVTSNYFILEYNSQHGLIYFETSFEKNCFSAWASTLNMGLINKVDMVCLSPVGYGV